MGLLDAPPADPERLGDPRRLDPAPILDDAPDGPRAAGQAAEDHGRQGGADAARQQAEEPARDRDPAARPGEEGQPRPERLATPGGRVARRVGEPEGPLRPVQQPGRGQPANRRRLRAVA